MPRHSLLIALTAALALVGCSTGVSHTGHSESSLEDTSTSTGHTREYFIRADEVVWDYAPSGKNLITDRAFTPSEGVFTDSRVNGRGTKYVKCLYRAYTDESFSTPVAQDPSMGYLGPTIYAEVGDKVIVHFKNSCSFANSIHVHGFTYDKASEGAPYNDGTTTKADDLVRTGAVYVYKYTVPSTAGPADMDGSTAMWMYHSHSDEISDVYAGMAGFIVVTKAGQANANGTPRDIDRNLFLLYEVTDENQSSLADKNFAAIDLKERESESFVESNLKHSINGFIYGNLPMPSMSTGQRVRWYVMAMGNEVDIHTPHWHGNTSVVNGMRMDSVSVFPGTMVTTDMQPANKGIWLMHCHVADHIAAGMIARYEVK